METTSAPQSTGESPMNITAWGSCQDMKDILLKDGDPNPAFSSGLSSSPACSPTLPSSWMEDFNLMNSSTFFLAKFSCSSSSLALFFLSQDSSSTTSRMMLLPTYSPLLFSSTSLEWLIIKASAIWCERQYIQCFTMWDLDENAFATLTCS